MNAYYRLIVFLQHHLLTCPSRKYLHMDCPGCGMQRSFICLLKGHLADSLHLHPALIPILVMGLLVPLHLFFNFPQGAKIIVALQIFIGAITLLFYLNKLYNHQVFY